MSSDFSLEEYQGAMELQKELHFDPVEFNGHTIALVEPGDYVDDTTVFCSECMTSRILPEWVLDQPAAQLYLLGFYTLFECDGVDQTHQKF